MDESLLVHGSETDTGRSHVAVGDESKPYDVAEVQALAASTRQLAVAAEDLRVAQEKLDGQYRFLNQLRSEQKRSQDRYQDLQDFCSDALLVTDSRGIIREANRASFDLFGDVLHIGANLFDYFASEDRGSVMQQVESIPTTCRVEHLQLRLDTGRVAGAKLIPVIMSVQAGRTGTDELHWLVSDRSAAADAEAELQRLRSELRVNEQFTAIGTLAAGLGHDVKNLLLPMRCRLESLAAHKLPDVCQADVKGLRHAVQYLQQLANNLQLLADNPDPSGMLPSTLDLSAWWDHVEPLMNTATPGHVYIEANFEQDLPPVAIAPNQLTQAVMNLVHNAGEVLSRDGHVRVWAQRARRGPFVRVGVSDDGPGMTPEVLRRALDPFFSTKPPSGRLSTGMGLSLVRGIVKSVGGSVRIDSSPGSGTTVVLRLPIAAKPTEDVYRPVNHVARAAVSVADDHLASTLCTLLNLSRLPAWRTDPHDPDDAVLWIAEPTTTPVELARAFLAADSGRRLVLYGSSDELWEDVPAVWIKPHASLKSIRDTLSELALVVLKSC